MMLSILHLIFKSISGVVFESSKSAENKISFIVVFPRKCRPSKLFQDSNSIGNSHRV
ncbi:hypothetical protein Hanom_Chr04g00359751 [Helianthus anomalus]